MNKTRVIPSLFVYGVLIGAFLSTAALAETSGAKKAVRQADKALTSGVRELGKGFKKASQAVDKAAKAGNDTVRRAVKGQEQ